MASLTTPEEAVAWLRREQVATLVHAAGVASLVQAVTGERVKGSWWGHAQGGLIFELANALEDSEEVHLVRIVEGKQTFVHADLWPALVRVVRDPTYMARAAQGLPDDARAVWDAVRRAGRVRTDRLIDTLGWERKRVKKARDEVVRRLLSNAVQEHTASGRHEQELQAWPDPPDMPYGDALRALQAALGDAKSAVHRYG